MIYNVFGGTLNLAQSIQNMSCALQGLEFILLGKSGQQDLTDDDNVNQSSQSSADTLCSGDSHSHKLLSRKTRLV